MKYIKARPTVYRGIQMRSRLEADFARYIDGLGGRDWEYEPQCFAGPQGDYLPDFRINKTDGTRVYVEVKPEVTIDQPPIPPPIAALRRMEVIFESDPEAALLLILWRYHAQSEAETRRFYRSGPDDIWWPLTPKSVTECKNCRDLEQLIDDEYENHRETSLACLQYEELSYLVDRRISGTV